VSPIRDGNGVQRDRVEKQMQREWSWKTGETDKEEEKEVADLRRRRHVRFLFFFQGSLSFVRTDSLSESLHTCFFFIFKVPEKINKLN
jgi:hypothetical protein